MNLYSTIQSSLRRLESPDSQLRYSETTLPESSSIAMMYGARAPMVSGSSSRRRKQVTSYTQRRPSTFLVGSEMPSTLSFAFLVLLVNSGSSSDL